MLLYALTHMHTHTHSRDRRVIILRFMAATDKETPGWALHWAGKRGVWVGGWMCKEERVASAYRARAIMPSMHVCVLAQPYTLTNPRTHTRTHSNNRDRQVSQSFLPSVRRRSPPVPSATGYTPPYINMSSLVFKLYIQVCHREIGTDEIGTWTKTVPLFHNRN